MRGPYTLEVEGQQGTFAPSEFGPLRNMRGEAIYNPDQLYKGACEAAQRVAVELEANVVVWGRVGAGGAKLQQAARYHQYREGDYVLVAVGGRSFNYVRCHRPRPVAA